MTRTLTQLTRPLARIRKTLGNEPNKLLKTKDNQENLNPGNIAFGPNPDPKTRRLIPPEPALNLSRIHTAPPQIKKYTVEPRKLLIPKGNSPNGT
jgi:hypothetical protein